MIGFCFQTSRGSEQDGLAARNHEGVLVVRGKTAVDGSIGPAVLVKRDLAGARGNNRLNGDDQPFGQFVLCGKIRVIGHRRRFMDRAPYAMAAKFLDRKSIRLNSSHVEISYYVFCL